ncbi:FkbM family methyltransferase [Anaeromicropila herbilytica]|uniref:Methyltransferase FkbM domain-containing protein n=1 Tax=Anaeromicropila herbilytica TaxID=2785025 RepID=A0A7R7EHG8_9FIRM|nr:FkbM family methyltransferase [Anaeromicropila herbilytica]BCN28839.1 hypothetical protein bsdtb5_01340 [Anaeromicropila herbilytica]
MKYISRTIISDIQSKYDFIIGWGTGTLLERNYRKDYYPMEFIVDGRKNRIDEKYQGLNIYPAEKLLELQGKILIVIYTIYEKEIIDKLNELGVNADTIIYNLLDVKKGSRTLPIWNGKNADDIFLLELALRLGMEDIQYLDIGVCHPIMRNNTFILHELGYHGVLVEPNPTFHSLIEEYRSNDTLLKIGASNQDSTLTYYNFPRTPGLNTFDKEHASYLMQTEPYTEEIIPIRNINRIISENYATYPNIIDIDVEGFDYHILESLDTQKYPAEIIMCECTSQDNPIIKLMQRKGYRVYSHTIENYIFTLNA